MNTPLSTGTGAGKVRLVRSGPAADSAEDAASDDSFRLYQSSSRFGLCYLLALVPGV